MLHALAANQQDVFGITARDVVMPVVPMFHANAWALGFICPMAGEKLVLPGAKDLIKSGGEWISSHEIEQIILEHPDVARAAVIAMPDAQWGERPLLILACVPGATPVTQRYISHLEGRIARWWLPDAVAYVDDIQLGATGKIDKRALRSALSSGSLSLHPATPSPQRTLA